MTLPAPAQFRAESQDGGFLRQPNRFVDRITADGASGYPAEAGRYQLYVSLACPWAHRSVIARRLLGLEDVIGMTVVDPIRDERGWRFTLSPGDRDPLTGAAYLSELYLRTDPDYRGRVTVPCVWDRVTSRIVTNDYPHITLQFETEFAAFVGPAAPDLYPVTLRNEIDAVGHMVYETVNNGVYRAGFATSQSAYEEAVTALFATLDLLDERLAEQRYLVGGQLTEADIRLFTTLVRFDAVYHGHFKCNLRKLSEYRHLWPYARDLYQRPGFGDTVDVDAIKRHYYVTHHMINPTGIVPLGPATDWAQAPRRDHLP